MRLIRYIPICTILVGTTLLQFVGCTAVGYYAGRAIDRHSREFREMPLQEAASVDKDAEICVITRDSNMVRGKFVEIDSIAELVYAGSYDALKKKYGSGEFPPGLGDFVTVFMNSGHSLTGKFLGFDFHMPGDHVDTFPDSGTLADDSFAIFQYCIIEPRNDPQPSRVFLRDVDRVVISNADTLGGRVLYDLARSGTLPLRSAIALDSSGVGRSIPINNVAHVSSMRLGGDMRWLGLTLGILVDAAVVTIATVLIVMSLSDYSLL